MLKILSTIAIITLLASCTEEPKPKKTVQDFNFLWNFSKMHDVLYSYKMTSIDEETYARNTESHSMKTDVIGELMVSSHGDRTASISIANAKKTIFSLTDDGDWSPANPQTLPKSTIGELTQYSQFNDDRLDAIWDAYLPLPLEEIKEGESYKLKISLPVGMESYKYVNGFNTLTFTGYKTIQNRKCIVLEGDIDVSDVDDLEFDGKYTHFMNGKGTYYFDPKDHVYVKADVEITVVKKVDSGEKEDVKKDFYMNRKITEKFSILLK